MQEDFSTVHSTFFLLGLVFGSEYGAMRATDDEDNDDDEDGDDETNRNRRESQWVGVSLEIVRRMPYHVACRLHK